MNDKDSKDFWFPAKRYGWGWGLPNCWQGWLVLLAFVLLLALAGIVFSPAEQPLGYLVSVLLLSGLLVGICWRKGEAPRWRWGASDEQS